MGSKFHHEKEYGFVYSPTYNHWLAVWHFHYLAKRLPTCHWRVLPKVHTYMEGACIVIRRTLSCSGNSLRRK